MKQLEELKEFFFTKDKGFNQIKFYEKVITENKAKVVFFRHNKKMIFFWDILVAIVTKWEELKEKLGNEAPPYVYQFDLKKGITELHF